MKITTGFFDEFSGLSGGSMTVVRREIAEVEAGDLLVFVKSKSRNIEVISCSVTQVFDNGTILAAAKIKPTEDYSQNSGGYVFKSADGDEDTILINAGFVSSSSTGLCSSMIVNPFETYKANVSSAKITDRGVLPKLPIDTSDSTEE